MMALQIGSRLGSYEITAHIGVGGMGEVYRARDTKLNRDVALKVLPEAFTLDPDRLARFEREARMLASLNHPHIGAIYGVEESAGVRALVLELVEGPTLADRLAKGPIPPAESLGIVRQIADALEAAHQRGIVHRDLKPANIKITPNGIVKVLDFGLAKAAASDGTARDLSQSSTVTVGITREGVILGTAAYMSPEQARGLAVDKRTDIWAFGCVLFEMLTSRAAFAGETLTDTLAAILERKPSWTALPHSTPAGMRRLLQRCLEKDPKRRLHDIADVRIEIDDALIAPADEASTRAAAPARRVEPVAIAALAGGAVIAALGAWVMMRPVPVAPVLPVRFAIVPPPAQPLNVSSSDRDLALSPDGRRLVYRAGGSGTSGSPLFVRAIDQLDAPLLYGGGAYAPFFSPDGRWIGFFENSELKKVSIAGGRVVTICRVNGGSLGASWGDDNTIVFATDDPSTGLWRVSAQGGEPMALTTPDIAQRGNDHCFPSLLPGGRGLLFTIAAAARSDDALVAVFDLRTGKLKTLVRGGNHAEYVDPSAGTGQAGYLIYAAADTLRAVRFDPVRLDVLSDPVTVVDHVMMKPSGAANYAVSRPGTLVYMPAGPTPMRSLVWVDRKGGEEPIKAPLRAYGSNARLSPDGTRVAVLITDQGNVDIWIWDLAGETLRRLTFDPGFDVGPVWTPDGRRIVFASTRAGVMNLYIQAADGTGTVDRLTTSPNRQWAESMTADGTRVIGWEGGPKTASDIVAFPLTSPSKAEPLVHTQFREIFPEVSPDGRYLAYQSNESGKVEVHVRPFPKVDSGHWQVSTGGGTRAVWARNGRELFYFDGSNTFTAVPVQTSGPTFIVGSPVKVFDTTPYYTQNPSRAYDVSPDGQRFLMIKNGAAGDPNATEASMVVVEHWFEELKARLPPK